MQEENIASTKTNNGAVEEANKDGQFSGTKNKKIKRVSRVSKKSHHWLPSIHEDYYGPRRHRSRHH